MMKDKKVSILNIVIVVLAVIFVMTLFGTILETYSILVDNYYDEDSFAISVAYEEYGTLVEKYYNNCGSDGMEEKYMQEYYELAKYFEAAFHYKIYAESGDTVRAEKYQAIMDEAKGRIEMFDFVPGKMDEKLGAK